jgi:hypothetical protein
MILIINKNINIIYYCIMQDIFDLATDIDISYLKRKREHSEEDDLIQKQAKEKEDHLTKKRLENEDRLKKELKEQEEKLREDRHQQRVALYMREIRQIQAMRKSVRLSKFHIPCCFPQKIYSQESCPICLINFKENDLSLNEKLTVVLTCGHLVHYKCIETYFSSFQSEGRCPVCRSQEKPIV